MSAPGPLAGLRVIDLTGDLGRFATKLLAEYGAEVCRPAGAGSRGASMPGPAGAAGRGVLDWWYDAAKTPIDLDLTTDEGRTTYRRLALAADVVIEAQPAGLLAELGIDHEHLVDANPTLCQVSVTPFGRTGPRAGWQGSDLVAGALGGVLSLTGTPDEPLNSWGGQNHNFAGFAAAISALAAVRSARRTGHGQLVDLSVHEVVTGSIENLFFQYFYDDELPLPRIPGRQGSLHWLGAYQVVPARTGHVMVTPTPQAQPLIDWMVECGMDEAEPFVGLAVEDLLAQMPELMAAVGAFARTMDAGPLFHEAQRRHIAFAEVQSVPQVADNPQFAHRRLFSDIVVPGTADPGTTAIADRAGADGAAAAAGTVPDPAAGTAVRGPWRLVRFSDTPLATPAGLPPTAEEAGTVAARWGAGSRSTPTDPSTDPAARPLEGLTVLDLSWVLAGPFATRLLGDLGADVIKVQTEERATLVNRPDYPYYPVWNRSKRSVTLDLKRPEALDGIRPLVERADVLVENYSSGVLDRLGLGWDQVREWNDRLVYISMSGCGHDGPWSQIISYAPTVHALCGLTSLTNPPGRGDIGCGFSLNDHAAGFAAALSVLAALHHRDQGGGTGQYIDMAQLEVGAYLLGPALVEWAATGHEARAAGNVDALTGAVPNEIYRGVDGATVAVTATDDAMWGSLAAILGATTEPWATVEGRRDDRAAVDRAVAAWCADRPAADVMATLQAAGVAAGVVQDAEDLAERDPQLAARRFWSTAESDVFGPRRHDRFPALWSRSRLEPYRPAPNYLGEANFEVWTEVAGLAPETVAGHIADGLFT
ncbi:MAG: CoA transferase [Acidimicrobiales bacterium]